MVWFTLRNQMQYIFAVLYCVHCFVSISSGKVFEVFHLLLVPQNASCCEVQSVFEWVRSHAAPTAKFVAQCNLSFLIFISGNLTRKTQARPWADQQNWIHVILWQAVLPLASMLLWMYIVLSLLISKSDNLRILWCDTSVLVNRKKKKRLW
jgi:hypothetical protein